jgi:hypothetical protein
LYHLLFPFLLSFVSFQVEDSVQELSKSICHRIMQPKVWEDSENELIIRNEEGHIISMNVADLITIVNTHMKYAKDSEIGKLPLLVLNECIGALETYQKEVINFITSKPTSTFGITYLCAIVNDAANLMEEVDNVLEEYQSLADALGIEMANTIVFVNAGNVAVQGLVDIIMGDLKPLLIGSYKNPATIDEIYATIVDYLNDFRGFLSQYFFRLLVIKLTESIIVAILADLHTEYSKLGFFRSWAISDKDIAQLERVGEGVEAAMQLFEPPTSHHYQKQIAPRLRVLADVTGFLQISSALLVLEFISILDKHPTSAPYLNSVMKVLEVCLGIRAISPEFSKEDKASTITICKKHVASRLALAKPTSDISPGAAVYVALFPSTPLAASTAPASGSTSPTTTGGASATSPVSTSAFSPTSTALFNSIMSMMAPPVGAPPKPTSPSAVPIVTAPTLSAPRSGVTSVKAESAPRVINEDEDEVMDIKPVMKAAREDTKSLRLSVFLGSKSTLLSTESMHFTSI